ncbi:MAG TPA: RHS repeat-associated core domain-containing protein, partial [Candidatus Limnocylindrales bacterium]|nr:RHS repeat-associated core domain-containing protein [Candidatus Limnocylindrales bacterium]
PATKLITRYGYDGSGHLLSVNVNCTTSGTTPPATASSCTGAGTQDASTNLITTYTYTANDRLDTETDPLGHVTKHQYDTHGNETSVIANYVAGQSATADRNVATLTEFDGSTTAGKAGLPTEVTDPVGNATTYTYDALGRQLTEVLPGDASIPALTRTTTYDELGNALTETDAWTGATRTTTRVYDLANRETQVTDAAGVVTSTAYDAAGNAAMTVADGVQTDRTFDGLGRAVTETVEDVGVTTHGFDAAGNEVHTGSADGVDTDRTFSFTGWALSETVDPLGTPLQTVKTYDRLGRESTSTVANGPDPIVTTTTYDRPGRAMTVTVAGAQTTNAYDRAGNRTSVTDPAGIVTTTTYDALDRPTTVVANDVASPSLPSQDVTTSTYYDATGTAVAVRDPAGTTVRTIANARGLGKQIIANCTDSGTTPTPNPPACTGAGTHNATTNVVSSVAFDGSGAATSTVQAVGTGAEATTETAFDAAGRVQAVKDPRGTISRTFYTGDKVAKTVVNCTTSGTTIPADWANCSGAGTQDGSYNLTTTYAYDARGNRVTEVGPNGRVTTSVYDEADRLEKTIANDVASPTLATEDVTTRYFYDDAGRQAAVASPHATGTAWTITRFVFDDAGRVVREIANCTNSGTSLDPDAEDPVACGGPDGTALGTMNAETNVVTDHTYNARGNRTKVVRPSPAATSGTDGTTVTTRFAYDAADRLCRVVENSTQSDPTWDGLSNKCADAIDGSTTTNVSTRYTSDGAGNLATMVDANGNTTTYAYDAAGRMTSLTDALGKAVSWTYNDLGQKTAENNRTDFPTPGSIGWTYDGAGRILTRTANGATTSYEYDATGNRTCAGTGTTCSTAADRITATHDRLNRPLTVASNADAAATTTYTYSLTSPAWADPTGTYLVTLDPFDRATSVDGPAVGAFSTTYRADGQPVSVSAPNGNTTTYAYDGLGRETGRDTNGTGGIDRADYQLAYNRAGQVLSEASTISGDPSNGSTAYAYDPQGRLASYDPPSATATTYGWDEVPNRTSVTPPGGGPVTTSFDAANRPTSDSAGGSYTSDPDGRLTARPGQRLEWDALSRLTKVKPPTGGSTIATYSYDPLDRLRLVDYGGSNRIRFRYVGLTTSVAQVIDDQSGAVIRNVGTGWGGERLLDWTGTNSNLRYYGTNAHHDTTWTGSSTGAVSATLRYDPWGTVSSSTGSSLPDFRFQGSWYDTQTDLSWVVTRWYAPALGRFVSEDSLLGTPADPPSRHLYAYAEGEPVASWDPDGRTAFKSWSIRNYGKYRGSLLLSLFIRAKYNYADYPGGQARMYGDNRSWGPDCKRSRGCISINFTNKTITARVNNTCGDFNLGPSSWFGYGCSSAFSIVPKLPWVCLGYHNICGYNQKVNVISVSEASSGVITIAWDITQSRLPILRPGLTVNGKMIIRPRRCCVYSPSVEYYGEGFPSEELYWYSYPYYQRRTIFQHSEGPWSYMSTGGNWHKTYGFPG